MPASPVKRVSVTPPGVVPRAGVLTESPEEQDVRDLWVVDAGDARFVLTGAGEDREFEELIATALATAPIQHPDQ